VRGQRHAPAAFYPRERPGTQEAGWAPGPVWTGAENLAPTGIRSPDRPARSQSLYRLSYTGPHPHILAPLNTGRPDDRYPKLKMHISELNLNSYEYIPVAHLPMQDLILIKMNVARFVGKEIFLNIHNLKIIRNENVAN
jgi:hypothetical protein